MGNLSTEELLIIGCGLVIMSYIFSIISNYLKVPSVLLLLFAGIAFKAIADSSGVNIAFSPQLIELLGVVGLIMIVLEAGLDLKLSRGKLKLIKSSFFSALIILVLSTAMVTAILYFWLHQPLLNCLVYALPLSIMSSSIVIPSIHHLTENKKEFLIYEASFSDILGILAFNYFAAPVTLTGGSVLVFSGNLLLSIVFSVVLSLVLFLILTRTKLNIKFFLIFSLLVIIYASGKMIHLPSLIIILVFGLLINNWELVKIKILQRFFQNEQVMALRDLLHSITAESSFLIRTFFFLLFGFSISFAFLQEPEVILVGSLIVLVLFLTRYIYLRFSLHTNIFPEVFFIPRGLITIVLFYKIPGHLKLASFNEGILFFVILVTSVIMMFGMLFYKKGPEEMVEEGQFPERPDIL